MTAVRVVIEGRVHGVWFRGWTIERATARGLAGWVRNRRDGTVEALFAGPEPEIEAMIAECHVGPPACQVTAVKRFTSEKPEEAGFRPLPSL